MKTLIFFLGGMLLSSVVAADSTRLALWITDPIGATSGDQCHRMHAAPVTPSTRPTLTEQDIIGWNRNGARWMLDPKRFIGNDAAMQLQDRCFTLALDGKVVSTGVVLSSYSARLTGFPAISVTVRNNALELQLSSSNHDRHTGLIHVDALDSILGKRADMTLQLQRFHSNNNFGSRHEWTVAVQQLIDQGTIRQGIPVAEVIAHLGSPSSVKETTDGKTYHWYFNTPMHVNPFFMVGTSDEVVRTFSFSKR